MSRGRESERAFDAAVAVAHARGQVVFVRTWPGPACDFLLLTPYGVVSVCVRRTRRIRAEMEEIVQDHRETLNRIRGSDHCAGVSSEFWLWSPYGTMRFFQIEGLSLVEISMHGLPLVPPVTGKISGRRRKSSGGPDAPDQSPFDSLPPEKTSGEPDVPEQSTGDPGPSEKISGEPDVPEKSPGAPAGNNSSPETIPGMAGQKNPASPGTGKPGPREPPHIRYLRKRNAEIQRKNEEEARARGRLPGPAREAPPSGGTAPPG